jgi:hypothetical protein
MDEEYDNFLEIEVQLDDEENPKKKKKNKNDFIEIDAIERTIEFIEKEETEAQTKPRRSTTGRGFTLINNTFDPSKILNLSLWLKADAGVTLSGSNVTAWADQSGNGKNATGADTLPTLQSSAINGYPAIRFNNIDSGTSKFVISSSFNLKNSSAFVVVKQLGANEYARYLSFPAFEALDYNADDGLAVLFNNGVPQLQITSNAIDATIADADANNVFAIASYKIDDSGNISLFYNGGSEATNTNSNMASQNGVSEIYIGQSPANLVNEGLYGDIAEIIMYSRAVTTPERLQVEQYLNSKYQIYPWRVTISGAGTTTSNGEYVWDGVTLSNNKPIYDKVGGTFDEEYISWDSEPNNLWVLYDSIAGFTYSSQDLITWNEGPDGSSPVPTSTLYYTP